MMLPSTRLKKLNGATLGQGEIAELRKNTTCGRLLRSLWRCPTEASSGSHCQLRARHRALRVLPGDQLAVDDRLVAPRVAAVELCSERLELARQQKGYLLSQAHLLFLDVRETRDLLTLDQGGAVRGFRMHQGHVAVAHRGDHLASRKCLVDGSTDLDGREVDASAVAAREEDDVVGRDVQVLQLFRALEQRDVLFLEARVVLGLEVLGQGARVDGDVAARNGAHLHHVSRVLEDVVRSCDLLAPSPRHVAVHGLGGGGHDERLLGASAQIAHGCEVQEVLLSSDGSEPKMLACGT
mmetsp:Transcript_57067/g.184797  ORF Transcript_57067/g.184797 Transcript_57067/m.184797 type:complete len:296 (-) Transcript_57067:7-894(-)